MRLLFVTHNFPRHEGDAPGAFVWRLAHALRDAGHAVDVLAPAAPGLAPVASIGGVPVERVAYGRLADLAYAGTMAETVRASWRGQVALLRLLDAVRRAVRRRVAAARREGTPFDLVHAHWWFPAGLAVRAARIGGGALPPYVVTMHGSDVRLARNTAPAHGPMRAVLRGAAGVAAVSRWLAETAGTVVPGVPIAVHPMPIDVARFAEADGGAGERTVRRRGERPGSCAAGWRAGWRAG